MGGTGGTGSSEQWSRPWTEQQPFLKDIYARAQGISGPGDAWGFYPGNTVAARDPATLEAENAIMGRAREGSSLLRAGQQELESTIRGDRFGSNPYLDQAFNRAATGVTRQFNRSVLPNLESRFAGAGRMDSGAYMGAMREAGRGLAGELSGMATDIYGRDYEAERGRQFGAIQGAIPMSQADYLDPAQMAQIGQGREMYGQDLLDDLVRRFEFNQSEPYNQIARYSSMIGAPVQESYGESQNQNWGFSI